MAVTPALPAVNRNPAKDLPSRAPAQHKCVHCQKDCAVQTWDHVRPQAWYPERAPEAEKAQMPSCATCNRELGRLEEGLLTKLGLCLYPRDQASLGIPAQVPRSLNAEDERSGRDRMHRTEKKAKLLRSVILIKTLPHVGIFPNFRTLPGVE
jgi:hypothetical protein